MEDTVFMAIRRRLADRKAVLNEYVMQGGASDYTTYAQAVAQYEMCTTLEEDVKELESRFMTE
jgi:hypothetical protein